MSEPILQTALELAAQGIAVIPVKDDGSKAPALSWRDYMSQRPDEDQLRAWFAPGRHAGLGIVTGAVSGHLEMTELEGRAAARLSELKELAQASGLGQLWAAVMGGWLELSPSGGFHMLYRLDGQAVPGNTKLARDADRQVLAETRGEGGFVVMAPTPGTHHPSGQPWVRLAGGPATMATLDADEREALHTLLATIDAAPHTEPGPQAPASTATTSRAPGGGLSPGDDYEARTTWAEILTAHGWAHVHTAGRTSYWRRPGKTIGISATTGHARDRDRLYVFSSSTDFDVETPYTKFGAYALLNHGGDHNAAAKALHGRGYGTPATTSVGSDLSGLITPPRPLTVIRGGLSDGANALDGDVDQEAQPAPALATVTLEHSEDGHSQQLIDAYGALIRYCPQRSAWLAWNGTVWDWQPAGGGIVREYAKHVARGMRSDSPAALTHKRKALSSAGTTGALKQSATDPRITVDIGDLDADPWTLNTPGGLVDLRDGTLRPPDPAALCTRSTTAIPDFEAVSAAWDAFLADTFGNDAGLLGYVQRLVGITLIGAAREQVLPFCHGPGANGKSTLLEALMHALRTGPTGYATAAPAEMLMIRKHSEHPAELAQLSGARLVVCSELDEGQRFAEAKVKQLTGSDSINARFLYGQPFTFTPTHTIWMLGNHRPQAAAGGMAFWRRVKLIEFSRIVPAERRDPALPDKLAEAAGVILAWAIRGVVDYAASGMREPAAVTTATAAYALEQDTVGRFVDDAVHLAPGRPDIRVKVADVRAAYDVWCAAEGETPVAAKRLTQELAARGVGQARTGQARYYTGMSLLDTGREVTDSDDDEDREWYR